MSSNAAFIIAALVNIWTGEGGVSTKVDARDLSLIAFDNRPQHASGLIGEIYVGTLHFVRRSPDRARQQMADPLLLDALR